MVVLSAPRPSGQNLAQQLMDLDFEDERECSTGSAACATTIRNCLIPSDRERQSAMEFIAREMRALKLQFDSDGVWSRFCNDCLDLELGILNGCVKPVQRMLQNCMADPARDVLKILGQAALDLQAAGIQIEYGLLSTGHYRVSICNVLCGEEKTVSEQTVSFSTQPLYQPYVVGGLLPGRPSVEDAFQSIGDTATFMLAKKKH